MFDSTRVPDVQRRDVYPWRVPLRMIHAERMSRNVRVPFRLAWAVYSWPGTGRRKNGVGRGFWRIPWVASIRYNDNCSFSILPVVVNVSVAVVPYSERERKMILSGKSQ